MDFLYRGEVLSTEFSSIIAFVGLCSCSRFQTSLSVVVRFLSSLVLVCRYRLVCDERLGSLRMRFQLFAPVSSHFMSWFVIFNHAHFTIDYDPTRLQWLWSRLWRLESRLSRSCYCYCELRRVRELEAFPRVVDLPLHSLSHHSIVKHSFNFPARWRLASHRVVS